MHIIYKCIYCFIIIGLIIKKLFPNGIYIYIAISCPLKNWLNYCKNDVTVYIYCLSETTTFYPQINQTQVQINQSQFQINQTQFQINQSQFQINQSQFQINQSQFQINQTQFQINHTQFQINQTQFQINQTQFQINQTQFQIKKKYLKNIL